VRTDGAPAGDDTQPRDDGRPRRRRRRRRLAFGIVAFGILASAAACASGPAANWQAPLHRRHPLTGKIYRITQPPDSTSSLSGKLSGPELVTPDYLIAQLAGVDYVLLGEQHDNPDHHRLQAWILRRLIRAGRRPALVMEMLDADQQPAIDATLKNRRTTAGRFAAAVDWQRRGWPDYRMYAPLIGLSIDFRLPVAPANLPRSLVHTLLTHKGGGIGEILRSRLGPLDPLPDQARRSMTREVIRAHCGYANRDFAKTMVAIQHARNVTMARSLARFRSAVLIAGAGHIRNDHGVEAILRNEHPHATATSLAFFEVSADEDQVSEYAAGFTADRLPYDYVWFTPRQSDQDPCERFRKQLEDTLGKKRT